MQQHKLLYIFPLLLLIYSLYSYTQVDPNLVLSSHPQYWQWQQSMWQIGYHNRPVSSAIYLTIILGLSLAYIFLLRVLKKHSMTSKQFIILIALSLVALIPSYPALSHDIFNYIFNAKMVLIYHANPHIQTANQFPQDPWLKFMNNVHTPAPYGYGFTLFSLLPYSLGHNYLQGEMLIFRLTMIAFLIALLWCYRRFQPKLSQADLALVILNPLILIEMIGNIHNDLIMMVPVFAAALLIQPTIKAKRYWLLIPAIALFIFSVSIKLATITLIVATILYWLNRQITKWNISFALIACLCLSLPLFTSRSQFFLPWYLTWSLTFLPFVKSTFWRNFYLTASIAGLLAYLPYLYTGNYNQSLLLARSVILFGLPLGYTIIQVPHLLSSPRK